MSKNVIYKLTSPSGKIYIGRTDDFDERMATHKYCANSGECRPLYYAIRKYGWDTFTKEIIDECESELEAVARELEYIVKFDSLRNGYNATYQTQDGGDVWVDKNTEKYKAFVEKMSEITTGEKNGMYGKTHSEDTKSKQKAKAKGRFSLLWFIDRYGEDIGTVKYNDRCAALKARKLPVDSTGRFVKK